MKQKWEYKKLGDVCDILNGLWTGKKEPFITVAVIRNTNFSKDCRLKLDDIAFIDVEAKQYASRKLKFGDIIVEKSGGSDKQPVGRVVLFNIESGEYSFSNFTGTLRIKDSDSLSPNFLYNCLYAYYLRGETRKLQSKTTGLHNLDMKGYLRLSVPVPPMSEQERIVAELDLLNGVLEKQKAQLKELDALAQSIFYDMFGDPIENPKGWEKKKWSELFTTILGKMLDAKKQKEDDVIRPYLGNTNVQWFRFDLESLKTMSFSEKELNKYALKNGDVLICEGGESGRCAVWNKNESEILFQKAIHRARINDCKKIVPLFVPFVMKELKALGGLKNFVSKATIEHLTGEKLNQIDIILPPLSLQQSFADKIASIEKQKAAITQSMAETQKLLDYTMDKYFG